MKTGARSLKEGARSQEPGARIVGLILLAAGGLYAQGTAANGVQNPLMTTAQMNQFCKRIVQLMEAEGVVIPDLQRSAGAVIENSRQACIGLEARPGTSQPTFALMSNLRAFLTLTDAIAKPFPFPETAAQQLNELRNSSERLDTHFRALLDSKEARLANADRDNLKRYAEDNRKLGPPKPGNPRVVFFGDSITDFWRLNEYFPDRDFVNRGISGQITGEMLGRVKADVIDLRPTAMVILAGTNDLSRSIPLTTIENNLLAIADLCDTYKIKVIFASVLPVSDYHKSENASYERTTGRPPIFIKALNEWIQSLCTNRRYVYLNYHAAMVDQSGQMQSDLADDGLHPNSKGYRIMAPLAAEAIQKVLPGAAAATPVTEPPKKAPKAPKKPAAKPEGAKSTSN